MKHKEIVSHLAHQVEVQVEVSCNCWDLVENQLSKILSIGFDTNESGSVKFCEFVNEIWRYFGNMENWSEVWKICFLRPAFDGQVGQTNLSSVNSFNPFSQFLFNLLFSNVCQLDLFPLYMRKLSSQNQFSSTWFSLRYKCSSSQGWQTLLDALLAFCWKLSQMNDDGWWLLEFLNCFCD